MCNLAQAYVSMRMKFVLPLVALSLSACVSDSDQQAMNYATDRQRCTDFGFEPGTEAFANCMMAADDRRQMAQMEADRRRDEQDRLQAISQMLTNNGRLPPCKLSDPDVHLNIETGKWEGRYCEPWG